MKLAFKTPHVPSPYEKLGRASLWNWFDDKGNLRPNFKEALELGYHVKHQKQNLHVLENHPHVRDQLVSELEKLGNGGHTLLLSIVQPILRGMIEALAPELIDDTPGGFSVSMRWTREFVKFYMNWTFHKGTTVASKLPTDWMEQGLNMNYMIAYLVKVYNIPTYLVINPDQTGIHLIPSAGGRT